MSPCRAATARDWSAQVFFSDLLGRLWSVEAGEIRPHRLEQLEHRTYIDSSDTRSPQRQPEFKRGHGAPKRDLLAHQSSHQCRGFGVSVGSHQSGLSMESQKVTSDLAQVEPENMMPVPLPARANFRRV